MIEWFPFRSWNVAIKIHSKSIHRKWLQPHQSNRFNDASHHLPTFNFHFISLAYQITVGCFQTRYKKSSDQKSPTISILVTKTWERHIRWFNEPRLTYFITCFTLLLHRIDDLFVHSWTWCFQQICKISIWLSVSRWWAHPRTFIRSLANIKPHWQMCMKAKAIRFYGGFLFLLSFCALFISALFFRTPVLMKYKQTEIEWVYEH